MMSFYMKIGRSLQNEILDLSKGQVSQFCFDSNCLNVKGVIPLISYAKIDSKSKPIFNLFIRIADLICGIKTVRVNINNEVMDVRVWASDYEVLKETFSTASKIENIYAKVKSDKTIKDVPQRPQVKLDPVWSGWSQRGGDIWFSEAAHLAVMLSDGKNYYRIEEKDLQGRAGEALSSLKCYKKKVGVRPQGGTYINYSEKGESGRLSIVGNELKFEADK